MRYSNGETMTKSRIENEEWYPHYQSLMEIAMRADEHDATSVDKLYKLFLEDYQDVFNEECPDWLKEKALRWAVLHAERMHTFLMDQGMFSDERVE